MILFSLQEATAVLNNINPLQTETERDRETKREGDIERQRERET
jgi:hypothetical protein